VQVCKNTYGAMLRTQFWLALAGLPSQGLLNTDPTVWLEGARPPQESACEYKRKSQNNLQT